MTRHEAVALFQRTRPGWALLLLLGSAQRPLQLRASVSNGPFAPVHADQVTTTYEWRSTAQMAYSHVGVSTIGLPDGRMLVAGGGVVREGRNVSYAEGIAEAYDPAADAWFGAASVPTVDNNNALRPDLLYRSSDELVMGGGIEDRHSLEGALLHLYTPSSNQWRNLVIQSDTMPGQMRHSVSVVSSTLGILVIGGVWSPLPGGHPYIASDMACVLTSDDSCESLPPLSESRAIPLSVRLHDGRILVSGGRRVSYENVTSPYDIFLRTAEIFDPRSRRWSYIAPMNNPRARHHGLVLSDGRVLVVGGIGGGGQVGDVYNPDTDRWTVTSAMAQIRGYATLIEIAGERVVLVGTGAGTCVDILDLRSLSWQGVPCPAGMITAGGAAQLPSGDVLVVGWGETNASTLHVSNREPDPTDIPSHQVYLPFGYVWGRR